MYALTHCSWHLSGDSSAKESQPYSEELTCPTWFIPVHHANGTTFCECNDNHIENGVIVKCPRKRKINLNHVEKYHKNELNISLFITYCMTYDFTTEQTVLGVCPYQKYRQITVTRKFDFFVTVRSKVAALNGYMCHFV